RYGLMACLVIATAGEIFLSLGWGLYAYRLGNIPLFVPPGHVLLLLLGLSLARRMSEAAANGIIVYAALYSLAAAAAGIDTLGAALFLVFAAASVAMPAQRRLYASIFVLSLALELYGTWLGNWTWARNVPGIALVTTNPPGAAGAFYCALDALAVQAARQRQQRSREDLVGAHHPRAEAAGAGEVLAGGPLDGVALPVAHRAVVVAAVAGDVIPGILLGNSPSSPADDDRDLRLVVEVLRFARAQDRLPVAHLRFGKAQEQRRLLGL